MRRANVSNINDYTIDINHNNNTNSKLKANRLTYKYYITTIIVSLIIVVLIFIYIQYAHIDNENYKQSSNIDIKKVVNANDKTTRLNDNKNIFALIDELFDLATNQPNEFIELISNTSNPLIYNNDPMNFKCPNELNRFPIKHNSHTFDLFRNNINNSFIFYQHIRKAGGTAFCDLANKNLKRKEVPSYYCMPDNRGSLATPPWNDSKYLMDVIYKHGFRIVANEWDVYLSSFASLPNVILATTFRHPIDRWYSQYRFEHLEHRDGTTEKSKMTPFVKWYNSTKGYTMNTNYYVKTFIGDPDESVTINKYDFYWTYHKYNKIKITKQLFQQSLNNLLQFHIIFILEYLSYPIVSQYLMKTVGFTQPIKQILPHEIQAKRDNHSNISTKDRLDKNEYEYLCNDNIYDILLFEISKRILLERLHCSH